MNRYDEMSIKFIKCPLCTSIPGKLCTSMAQTTLGKEHKGVHWQRRYELQQWRKLHQDLYNEAMNGKEYGVESC